jgi:ABC-type multidrug transport system fused ATPase/permease subunit
MNAVERVEEYMHLNEESPAIIPLSRPPSDWPTQGFIKVSNLSAQYDQSIVVLKHLNFVLYPGEKIGVVGRTGSGKSSLVMSIFRFLDITSGSISIDGIDITKIGLSDLRSKLTIIPQVPTLFPGTLRNNLDPFDEYSDDEIWGVLNDVHFLDAMQSGSYSLEFEIAENSQNLSAGQIQLLCLARALLKRSKILVIDEATSSMDYELDAEIQKTIRESCRNTTLICVAHRLASVIDYDRIMVLENGHIAQFNTPKQLISEDGIFRKMCESSGDFDALLKSAKG